MVKETVYERRGRGRAVARILGGALRKLRSVEDALGDANGAAAAVDGSDGGDDPTAPLTEAGVLAERTIRKAISAADRLYEIAKSVAGTPMPKTDHGDRREYDDASELASGEPTPSDEEPSG